LFVEGNHRKRLFREDHKGAPPGYKRIEGGHEKKNSAWGGG